MSNKLHCENCFCHTDDLVLKAYKVGSKVRLIGDNFIGEIRNLVIGLRNIRYSVIYPGHKYCIDVQHSSLEFLE